MTLETLHAAEECIREMDGHGTCYRYKHSVTKKILYAVFTFTQFVDVFDAPYCDEVKVIYNGTDWLL